MKNDIFTKIAICTLLLIGCSTDNEDDLYPVDNKKTNTAVLRLDGGIQHFDDDVTSGASAATRAATSEWDDGAKLYIHYQTASGKVNGIATYNENTDEWSVDYYGSITRNETTPCEVYYFENAKSVTDETVELDYTSAVFADKDATYLYKDGVIHLKTHLMPQTGRIRFRGEPGYRFSFTGVKWLSNFEISSFTLSEKSDLLSLTIMDNGYTEYLYALSENPSDFTLIMDSYDEECAYVRLFESLILSNGRSGFVNVPTKRSRNGWATTDKLLPPCPDGNHPHMIDLGGGLMWSCCNLGALSPTEYGEYYAWGEIETKSSFSNNNYKYGYWSNYSQTWYFSKYSDKDEKRQLDLSDDAARIKLGDTWRMATNVEWEALMSDCSSTFVIINNVKGLKLTGTNGNSIFLPFAGWFSSFDGLEEMGDWGFYWTSSMSRNRFGAWYDHRGMAVTICSNEPLITNNASAEQPGVVRTFGLSVRPVSD